LVKCGERNNVCRCDANSDCYVNTYPFYTYTGANCKCNSNCDSDRHANSYGHQHAYTYGNRYLHTDTHAN
jgi:hypothetical protein